MMVVGRPLLGARRVPGPLYLRMMACINQNLYFSVYVTALLLIVVRDTGGACTSRNTFGRCKMAWECELTENGIEKLK